MIIPKRSVNSALWKIRDLYQHYLFHRKASIKLFILFNAEKPVKITNLKNYKIVPARNGLTEVPDDDFCL